MSLVALGINHKTASVELREQIAFSPDQMVEALQQLKALNNGSEAVVVSTCNRTELYCNGMQAQQLIDWLVTFHQVERSALEESIYLHQDVAAVNHLMRVSCGLDSLVLGEPQILGQIKQAYGTAKASGSLALTLDKLFQRTFSVAKRVRTDTNIGANAVSVAFAAVSLAKQIFAELVQTNVLLIGAGETIELVAKHLMEAGVTNITIANRTLARAESMTQDIGGTAITLAQIPEHLAEADVVISSTASTLPILGKGMVESAISTRRHRPMLLVDIAVPRDIEAQVGELDDVYLYTVDDLQGIVEQNMASRRAAADEAELIATEQAQEFIAWTRSLKSIDYIKQYREQSFASKDELLDKALQKISQGADAEKVMVELANKLTNKLIHCPTRAMSSASHAGEHDKLAVISNALGLNGVQ
ncbi:glutamyl-tRNA reductase [Psychrobium sp. 1_MG-2023]|uniref:glutamyl-tRNA reductase n=1 Tax=Psychrobium sp. 1_MG-2023 TaxID=3062624 RepID=UPI000C3254BA|nr:glutamyl-tRNA reductase [Psychrobium sp. 1_MG-2023]MDP2560943.1 glutamyl-tRNA reductase [Psychrobium sp. 1_MG-2023]PKF56015.1 glutamyl-tRNA reductase [Alteromonadales bacterium alter-6D02]